MSFSLYSFQTLVPVRLQINFVMNSLLPPIFPGIDNIQKCNKSRYQLERLV